MKTRHRQSTDRIARPPRLLSAACLIMSAGLFGCDFDPVAPDVPQGDSITPELTGAEALSYGGYSYPHDLAFAAVGPIALNDHGLVVGVDNRDRFVRSDRGVNSFFPSPEGWSNVTDVNNGGVALVQTGIYGGGTEFLWPNGGRSPVGTDDAFFWVGAAWKGFPAKALNNNFDVVGRGAYRTGGSFTSTALKIRLDGTHQTTHQAPQVDHGWGTAVDVNDASIAVGWFPASDISPGPRMGFLWLPNGHVWHLDPPSHLGTQFDPVTITNAGVVYGTTDSPMGGTGVVSWSWSTGWRLLLYRHPICRLQASEKGRLIYDDCAGTAYTWYGGVEVPLPKPLGGMSSADDVNTCGVIAGRLRGRAVVWGRRRCD